MRRLRYQLMTSLASLGPRYLPFADVATPDLPLGRLLRLSLFQVSVGMTMVLLVGTLNRVMIVELGVPATTVGLMVALPILFAPFRAMIGHRSDTHRSQLGWRRVPFIWKGTLLQFGGLAIMPFALLVLAGKGASGSAPAWIGQVAAASSFLFVGAGAHMVQTVGLALATDLTPSESHPRVVGLMYVTLLGGMIVSALLFGSALTDFTPGRLVSVIQSCALASVLLNGVAIWKQESRGRFRISDAPAEDPTFMESWAQFRRGENAVRRLFVVGLGTMAFGMADILLEPFGGQVLKMTVSETTKLTALLALGGMIGFSFAAYVLGRGADPYRMTRNGALIGIPAFALVIAAAPLDHTGVFLLGNFGVGFGAAVFGHGTLTVTMSSAPKEQAGLALGAWGAVQGTAAGAGMVLSGPVRDLVNLGFGDRASVWNLPGAASGYLAVYGVEIVLLCVTLIAILPLIRPKARTQTKADERATHGLLEDASNRVEAPTI